MAEEILQNVKEGKITIEQATAQLEKVHIQKKENITYKISTKGAISFYNIRRLPITLYKEELNKIVNIYNTNEFKQYIQNNASQLSQKK